MQGLLRRRDPAWQQKRQSALLSIVRNTLHANIQIAEERCEQLGAEE